MPTAVTHLLVPLLIMALVRDYIISKKGRKSFPLHYVLIAGIGGVLPDIDIIFYLFLNPLGYSFEQVHRQWMHSLFIPLIFLILYLPLKKISFKPHRKHILNIGIICLMLSLGTFVHLVLDGIISGDIHPFSPLSSYEIGLNLVSMLPQSFSGIAIPLFEGILLLIWIVYLEWKHKISDFI